MKKIIGAFLVFLRGFLMGIADIIPGVSGGTIALITGIYERLIEAISRITAYIGQIVSKRTFSFKNLKKDFNRIYLWFLLPLIIGIVSAFLLFSRLVKFLLDTQPSLTYSFFFGLIIASAYFVYKKIKEFSIVNVISSILGIIFAYIIVGLNMGNALSHTNLVLFFSGAIAISAMILPGISGSFILLLIGQYEYLLNVLHNFEIIKIIVFLSGAVIGLLLFSKFLNYFLKKYHNVTMAFLSGLMLGSLRLPIQVIQENIAPINQIIIIFIVGIAIVIAMESFFNKK